MSANHEPMHGSACARCARRSARLAAFAERMAFDSSKAGQRAAAKAQLLRVAREQHWRDQHPRPRRIREKNVVRMIRRATRRVMRARRPAVAAQDPTT